MKLSPISILDSAIVCCSCGLCCSKNSLCEKCEISTLRANGLPEEFANEIHGLEKTSSSHSNGFKFSKLYIKIRELIKRYYAVEEVNNRLNQ